MFLSELLDLLPLLLQGVQPLVGAGGVLWSGVGDLLLCENYRECNLVEFLLPLILLQLG